jgi:hypothetical protein
VKLIRTIASRSYYNKQPHHSSSAVGKYAKGRDMSFYRSRI